MTMGVMMIMIIIVIIDDEYGDDVGQWWMWYHDIDDDDDDVVHITCKFYFSLMYWLFIFPWREVGRSRRYCNTGPTRGESGEAPNISPVSKNQFNIEVPQWGTYQILSW